MNIRQITSQRRTPAHEAYEACYQATREGRKFTRLFFDGSAMVAYQSPGTGKLTEIPARAV